MRAKAIFQRIGVILACIGVLSYTVFHVVSLFESEISTIVVGESTEEKRLGFDGYIFRDETLVTSAYGGAVEYLAYDGLKVAANETLAYVYEEGNDEGVSDRVKVIDREIKTIKQALSDGASLDELPDLNSSVGDLHADIMKKLAEGDLRGLSVQADSLTAEMGKVASVTGKKEALRSTLASLEAQRTHIIAAGGDKQEIKSDRSGYFYSNVDGYEGIFTTDAAQTMTVDDFKEYALTPSLKSGAIGKMTYDTEWRFVTLLNEEDASYFEEGERYEFIFTGNGDIKFPLILTKKAIEENTDEVLLVFFCDRAPSEFSFDRFQSVEAVVESVSGIKVPKSATHKTGGKLYVYILQGSVVLERRIKVIYEGSDFYTVENGAHLEAEDGKRFLQSNDVLITDGNNLFDGRILE